MCNSIENICILSPMRIPTGSFNGAISQLSAVQLGAEALKACLKRNDGYKDVVEEIYLGNVLQSGNGQNPARQAAVNTGLSVDIPAATVNTVCGSGLHSVIMAYNAIAAGSINAAIAGGMESMSNAPYLLRNARNGYRLGNGEVVDSLVADGLTCPFNQYHMGITAENVAEKYNISRQEQDEFAYQSQIKAAEAQKAGKFKDEIEPITITNKKGSIVFSDDEGIRADTSIEKLAKLRPAFKAGGTVTAGNASTINDGAAAMVVMSHKKCMENGFNPAAYIKGYSLVGLEPSIMGMGPAVAIKALVKKYGIKIDDIGLFELNEAFAAQSIAVLKELELNPSKVNVNGGAIALGHPLGASGARILVTLIHEMIRKGEKYGVASLCIGTGMGIAILVENATI